MNKNTSTVDNVRCRESATYQTGNVRLDRDAGILRGVKVLGWASCHGRRYEPESVREALSQYLNAKSNLDHSAPGPNAMSVPETSIKNRFGKIINPIVCDDGLYADYKYLKRHPFAPTFEEMAEDAPDLIGLSHDVVFRGVRDSESGDILVKKIVKVHSVDLVADPGSTKGLHESAAGSESDNEEADASLDLSDAHALTDSHDDDGDGCEARCDAAIELVSAVIRDKSLSFADRKKQVLVALNNFLNDEKEDETTDDTKPTNKTDDAPSKEPDDMPTETKVSESASEVALKAQLATLEAENKTNKAALDEFRAQESLAKAKLKAKTLCTEAGLPPQLVTDEFVDTLIHAQESAWEGKIKDRKIQVGGYKDPTSAAPDGDKPASLADLKKHVYGA